MVPPDSGVRSIQTLQLDPRNTYLAIAVATGLSVPTIQNVASGMGKASTIERICRLALVEAVPPPSLIPNTEFLEWKNLSVECTLDEAEEYARRHRGDIEQIKAQLHVTNDLVSWWSKVWRIQIGCRRVLMVADKRSPKRKIYEALLADCLDVCLDIAHAAIKEGLTPRSDLFYLRGMATNNRGTLMWNQQFGSGVPNVSDLSRTEIASVTEMLNLYKSAAADAPTVPLYQANIIEMASVLALNAADADEARRWEREYTAAFNNLLRTPQRPTPAKVRRYFAELHTTQHFIRSWPFTLFLRQHSLKPCKETH